MLFREMPKQKDTIDFTKLLSTFMPSGQDPQEWDTKLTSIKNLVQATLEHYKTLCPQDPQQAILEELEKLKAENAALKASQVPDPNNSPPHHLKQISQVKHQVSQIKHQVNQVKHLLETILRRSMRHLHQMHRVIRWRPIDARMEQLSLLYTNQVLKQKFGTG